MKKPDLEIIIVSYNAEFWLKKTLTTLKQYFLRSTKYDVEVTVVDNASTDDSVSMVKRQFRTVTVMQLPENKGFGYANNRAMEKSEARYVMLLNSDMEFTTQSHLDSLIAYMDETPQIGALTPRVQFTNGRIDPAAHRGEPTPWASLTYFLRLEQLMPTSKTFGQYHQGYKNLAAIHTVDACSGAAMIIRRSILDTVGLFDERFFMYAEDLDLCKRIREHGYVIVWHPGATIIHHKYKSGIRGSSRQIARSTKQHFYNTMLQYYDKHYRHMYPEFVRTLIKTVISIKKGA